MTRSRKRRRSRRGRGPFVIAVLILAVAAALTVGIILLRKYRHYTGYTISRTIEMSNSEENTQYYRYGNGFLKCAGDGVTFFTSDGIVWSENYTMLQPMMDICGDYIAVADMGQRNVYLYDRSGFINRINLSHNITDVEVSQAGVIAVAANEGNINFIEIRDRRGNEIMTEKSLFSSSGFLMDMTLSDDGTRLAAVFVTIEKGTLKSKVVFYDLSANADGSDIITGTFSQYDSVLLTTVQFMDRDVVCAVGDRALSLYDFSGVPELVYEDLEFDWEIQSLFFQESYIGMVVEENDSVTKYAVKVFDTEGNLRLDLGVDFSFGRADFAGDNVLLYSYHECLMYSFAGIEKFYYPFEQHIEELKSADGVHFVYGTNSRTEFITLK